MAKQLKLRLKEASNLLAPLRGKFPPGPLSARDRRGIDDDDAVASALAQLDHEAEASHFCFIATYSSLLRRCANAGSFADGKLVHDHLARAGYASNIVLAELLIQMYGKCKRLDDAREVFDRMPRRSVYCWNLMLGAYVENGFPRKALDLYRIMDLEPDSFTFSTVLAACSSIGALEEGKIIHARMNSRNELVPDTVSYNSLITMYARCGSIDEAKRVFDGIAQKNVISWNCMIAAFAQHGHSKEAIGVYYEMESRGASKNLITFSTALGACANMGRAGLDTGKRIHQDLAATCRTPRGFLRGSRIGMWYRGQ